jgi:hypothetical protein
MRLIKCKCADAQKHRGRRRDYQVSPTPSVVIRNRGALERLLGADPSLTRTGPYDVFDNKFTVEDREVALG